jgi:hypothetical protein
VSCIDAGIFNKIIKHALGHKERDADFTNIDEIKKYWSYVIDIKEWGVNSKIAYNGGHRAFIYGTVK